MTECIRIIDINSDIGEGFPYDLELMKYISSSNICCGAHAGSLDLMKVTIQAAVELGIAAGAHPGYPDRYNFGRIDPGMSESETIESIVGQMLAFNEIVRKAGSVTSHMKLHGALYNKAAVNPEFMYDIVKAVVSVIGLIPVYSLAGSDSIQAIEEAGGIPVREVFADRAYNNDGTLVSRKLPGSVITDGRAVAERVLALASGRPYENIPHGAESICIHGDTPGALELAYRIKNMLEKEGIAIAGKL